MAEEPAIVVGDRKELTYLLSQAAELEHGLMCEYLYAAFSLKRTAGPGLRADQLDSVERWRKMIFSIAAQEMLHWAMVQNPPDCGRVCPLCEPAAHAASGEGPCLA